MIDRAEIESQIAALRRERGQALLAGKAYNDAPITKLQNELDRLADLEAARTQQANEETAKAAEAEIAATKTEIEQLKIASAEALASSRGAYAQLPMQCERIWKRRLRSARHRRNSTN